MRDKVLRLSSKLKNYEHNYEFNNVFIRPDRKVAESIELYILIKEQDKENEDLKKSKNLISPFDFLYGVIYFHARKCRNMSTSMDHQHPFANCKEACEARKKRNFDNSQ